MPTRSSAAAAASSISPPRPPLFSGFGSTTSSQGSSSSHARRSTRSTAPSTSEQQQQQPMDSSFWSPGSSASSVFQLAPPTHVKDEPDQLAGHFPSLRLASASEAESGTDADRYDEQPLRAYKPSGASSSSSKATGTRGAKGGSKRAKVSEDDDDDDEGDEPESGADGGGVKRKLSLKTRNRLKQRAHRERRALHLSTLESQVAEMATLKADLAQAQAALAHADAVGQGQRMTYEALIRDLSMRDREREGLLLAFQSEIFRLRALLGGNGVGGASNGQDGSVEPATGAEAGGSTAGQVTEPAAKGALAGAGPAAAVSGASGQAPLKAQPPADGSLPMVPPQPYPFAAMGHQPMQQPFYFFAPPPPPAQGQPHPFAGPPVWHGPPPAFGPPPAADGRQRSNGGAGTVPAAQAGAPHQHSPHYYSTPPGEGGMPYNLFPPHLRPAATGLSPKASPEGSGLAPPANAEASSSTSAASPSLSQQGFGDDAGGTGGGRRSSTSPAGQAVAVSSPPVPSSSKLLSKLPQLQTQFQPSPPLPAPPRGTSVKEDATTGADDGRTPAGKEPLDSLVPMITSPSILTPTAAAPHHGLYPAAGGPLPSPFSAFGPYGYSNAAAGGGGASGHNWSFTATTPTNGMGSALWGGLGLPGGQTWPWMGMGGGVSPVATSPAWAAWGQPPSGRPSSSGTGESGAP